MAIVGVSCGTTNNGEEISQENERKYFLARVTFYTDCPKWGRKTASGKLAEEGTTIAAEGEIPFGTEFKIPRLKEWINTDGIFIVHDRGSAVESRKASSGKLPVIDVYVSSYDKVRKLGARSENIFKIYHD